MKNTLWAFVFAAVLFSFNSMAQNLPKIKNAKPAEVTKTVPAVQVDFPKMVIDKTEHDFGKIDKSKKVTAHIKFRNEGKAVLEIKDIKTSCGCTSAKPEKRVYQPGESGEIAVTFNPARFQGPITKTVTIFTNDPEKPQSKCKIKANIIVDIMVKPRVLFVQKLKRNEVRTEKITIYTERLDKLEVTELKSDRNFATCKIERVDPKKVNIVVTVNGADIPKDQKRVFANLSYKTNSVSQADVKTRVHVTIQDPVEVQPPAIYLFGSKKGFARQIKVNMHSTVETKLQINEVSVELDGKPGQKFLTAEVLQNQNQRKGITLQVKLLDTAEKGKFQGKIRMKTNLKEQPEVVIPLKGSVI
jgi:hypothetical protein